jgi:hypothetical protein
MELEYTVGNVHKDERYELIQSMNLISGRIDESGNLLSSIYFVVTGVPQLKVLQHSDWTYMGEEGWQT